MKRALIAILALGLILFLIGCPPPAPDSGPEGDQGNGTEVTNGADETPNGDGDITNGDTADDDGGDEGMDDGEDMDGDGEDDVTDGADEGGGKSADDAAG